MQALDPEFLVVAHLPWRIAHDRIQILADEGAGIVAGNLRGVDDGGAGADQGLEVVHHRHALAERLLGLLAAGDVRPRADDLERPTLAVVDDPEGVLDPDVMPVAMAEAILDASRRLFRPAAPFPRRRAWHPRGCSRTVQKSLSSSISQEEKPMMRETFSLTKVQV